MVYSKPDLRPAGERLTSRSLPEKIAINVIVEIKQMYSKSTIKARPGWSEANFDRLLGEPDEIRKNYGRAPMRFYSKERVIAAEASETFEQLQQPFKTRVFHVIKGVLPSSHEFVDDIENMPIQIVEFVISRVYEGAIGHYNANKSSDFATRRSSKDLLNRISVEYACDVLAIYDHDLVATLHASGDELVYRLVRKAIYHGIASTYPELTQECFRQIDRYF